MLQNIKQFHHLVFPFKLEFTRTIYLMLIVCAPKYSRFGLVIVQDYLNRLDVYGHVFFLNMLMVMFYN